MMASTKQSVLQMNVPKSTAAALAGAIDIGRQFRISENELLVLDQAAQVVDHGSVSLNVKPAGHGAIMKLPGSWVQPNPDHIYRGTGMLAQR
jgi:hypothetical protein